jgi:MoxR-like ATPase
VSPEIQALQEAMERLGYIADEAIATALFLAREMRKPLLVEGVAGSGRPSSQKCWQGCFPLN